MNKVYYQYTLGTKYCSKRDIPVLRLYAKKTKMTYSQAVNQCNKLREMINKVRNA